MSSRSHCTAVPEFSGKIGQNSWSNFIYVTSLHWPLDSDVNPVHALWSPAASRGTFLSIGPRGLGPEGRVDRLGRDRLSVRAQAQALVTSYLDIRLVQTVQCARRPPLVFGRVYARAFVRRVARRGGGDYSSIGAARCFRLDLASAPTTCSAILRAHRRSLCLLIHFLNTLPSSRAISM